MDHKNAHEDQQRYNVERERYDEARKKTKHLARSGVLSAFIWLCLIMATVVSNFSLSLRLAATFFLLLAVLKLGLRSAFFIYIASNILGFIFPGLWQNLPYTLYFAPYLLFVFFLNSKWRSKWAIVLRVLVGAGLFCLLALFYREVIFSLPYLQQVGEFYWLLVIFVAVVGTAVYDYILALFTKFYYHRLDHLLKDF